MILSINDRPMNGFDVSRHNGTAKLPLYGKCPDWLWYYGMKACDSGGTLVGEDPQFRNNRAVASAMDVRWRGIYFYLRGNVPTSTQMALFTKTVGKLEPGEFVFLDWEEASVTFQMIEEYEYMMRVCYPNRWAMYINDSSADMISWLERPTCPIIHPNYTALGDDESKKFDAMIWQQGVGMVPEIFSVAVPIDFCMKPDELDRVSGR